jgi:ATP-dependent DNA helicase RecG
MFSEQDLKNILNELIRLPSETEWLEFKEANDNFSTNDIGKYFSALCNEANLLKKDFAWLVFGVNKNHKIVGTDYRIDKPRLQSLKQQIADGTTDRLSFVEIHEIDFSGKRIIMFQIPPAPIGLPISWKGHYYGREHESLGALGHKYDKIRSQKKFDWSAQIIENASIEDLDAKAIDYARKKFKEGNERRDFYNEIDTWDTVTFLNKARLAIEGKITTTTLLLLGKPESKRFLFPNLRITYVYINEHGEKQDYEHYDPPFLLERDNLLSKLKNKDSKFKLLPDDKILTPIEIHRYDNWVILEALNNCIAHQDYTKQDKIIVTEKSDYKLIFRNSGSFYYGTIEDYIFLEEFTPPDYRNPFLAEAMERIGMIDTVGSGIKRIFNKQKEKYLPLPEYVLGASVELTILADNNSNSYTSQLFNNQNLDLGVIFLIDKKQKGFPIDDKDFQYIIISFLKQKRRAGREDINELLLPHLDSELTIERKKKKIRNLLYSLSKNKKILNISKSTKKPIWTLS